MSRTLALVGNPNVGKTAVFNALTGLSQTTGNYPGVTVDRKYGQLRLGDTRSKIVDLPGAYSLAAQSPDEMIVVDVLLDQQRGEDDVDGLVVVLDASNLERNLYLLSQLLELGKPIVVALNMVDVAKRRAIFVDPDKLSERLGVPVVPICAHKAIGVDKLKEEVLRLIRGELAPGGGRCVFSAAQNEAVQQLFSDLEKRAEYLGRPVPPLEAFRVLMDEDGYAEQRLLRRLGPEFGAVLESCRQNARNNGSSLAAQEAMARYAWVREVMDYAVTRPAGRPKTRSTQIDDVLTHRVFGTLVFLGLMALVFQFIYAWAGPIMDLVDTTFGALGGTAAAVLPDGMLESLVVDGIIAGVGSVLIFLPQIIILSFFIAILEDCGYMARAAFLMDRLLGWCGLSGQAFIPMLSSFACAIPGILATRIIPDRRDRFTTIMVAPLMSCSARLPVYTIMIAALIPSRNVLGGLLNLQGLTLFAMYGLGIAVAVPVAWILKKTVFKGAKPPFILEMPSYKRPQPGTVARKVWREGSEFAKRAGTLIFAVTIIVWALAYFPRSETIVEEFAAQRAEAQASIADPEALHAALDAIHDAEAGAQLASSFLGRAGHVIEPVFRPLGWDWRIATAALASFPAREIVVATLGTLFHLGGDEDAESQSLRATLRAATWSGEARPLFTVPVALSIMVFFALCCQCGATLFTIRRETKQWRWPIATFAYMTTLSYVGAFLVYHVTTSLGW